MKLKHLVATAALCLSSIFTLHAQTAKKTIDAIPQTDKAAEDAFMAANAAKYTMVNNGSKVDVTSYARVMHRLGFKPETVTPHVADPVGFVVISNAYKRSDTLVLVIHALSDFIENGRTYDFEKLAGQDVSITFEDRKVYTSVLEPQDDGAKYNVTKTFFDENGAEAKKTVEVQTLAEVLAELKILNQSPAAFLQRLKAEGVKPPKPAQ